MVLGAGATWNSEDIGCADHFGLSLPEPMRLWVRGLGLDEDNRHLDLLHPAAIADNTAKNLCLHNPLGPGRVEAST